MPVDLSEGRRSKSAKKEKDPDDDAPLDITKQNIGLIEIDLYIFDRERSVLQFVPGNIDLVKDFLDASGAFFDAKPYATAAYRDRTPLMFEIRQDGVDV